MDFDPAKLASDLLKHGHEWADKKAAAELLAETKGSILSQIALKFLADGCAVNKAEMMAEATQEYQDHVKSMVLAKKEAIKAEVQYNADRTYIDLVRSQESTKRAEMNIR